MDWQAFWLTLRLAALVAGILLLVGLPLAYWISFSRWKWKFLIEAIVALPVVLPPTVLGFYVLVALGSAKLVNQRYSRSPSSPASRSSWLSFLTMLLLCSCCGR